MEAREKKKKKRARRRKGGEEGDTDVTQEVEERGGETWKIIRRNKNMGWEKSVPQMAGIKNPWKRLQPQRSRLKESLTHGRWSSGLPPPLRLRLSGCRSRAPGQNPQMSVWLPRQQMEHHHGNYQRQVLECVWQEVPRRALFPSVAFHCCAHQSIVFFEKIIHIKIPICLGGNEPQKNYRKPLKINTHFCLSCQMRILFVK